MALGADGTAFIAFLSTQSPTAITNALWFAKVRTADGVVLSSAVVDSFSGPSFSVYSYYPAYGNTSIAVDGAGNPQIAYSTGSALNYVRFDGIAKAWVKQAPDPASQINLGGNDISGDGYIDETNSQQLSLALDAAGNGHIAYYDGVTQQIKYVSFNGTAWGSPEVAGPPEGTPVFPPNSTTLTSRTSNDLAFTWNGTNTEYAWRPGGLNSDGSCSAYGFTYGNFTAGSSPFSFGGGLSAGTTYTFQVCNFNVISPNPNVPTGACDNLIVASTTVSGTDNNPTYISCGGATGTGGFYDTLVGISLALDGSGVPNISYQDYDTSIIYHAVKNGVWAVDTVNTTGANPYLQTSLALDGAGNPSVAFGDYSGAGAWYSWFSAGTWQAPVPAANIQAYTLSLTLDASGNPRMVSNDLFNLSDNLGDYIPAPLQYSAGSGFNFPAPMGGSPRGKVQAPDGFTTASVSSTTITWSWTSHSTNDNGFRLYEAASSTGPFVLAADTDLIGPCHSGTCAYTQNGLTPCTSHFAYVAAVNAGGVVTSSGTLAWTVSSQAASGNSTTQVFSPFTLQTVSSGTPLLSGTLSELQNYYVWQTGASETPGSACPIASLTGDCLSMTASPTDTGTGPTQLISAVFPTTRGQFYAVHLQAMSGDASTWMGQLQSGRNGPTFENIDVYNLNAPFQLVPSSWTAYDFYFEANENLPNGRILMLLPIGSHMILGALTVTPVTVSTWKTLSQDAPLLSGTLAELQRDSVWAPAGAASDTPGVACPIQGVTGNCLSLTSSPQAATQLISATFPTVKGQFYAVYLQAMSGDASTWIGQLSPNRNGPTYEDLDAYNLNASFQLQPSTWTSCDFYFQANETLTNGRISLKLPAGSHMILGALILTPVTVQAFNPTLPQVAASTSSIRRDYFGMTWQSSSDPWPAASFGTIRSWDFNYLGQTGISWQEIETARGTYNWTALDYWIANAQSHHVDALYTFGRTPVWASSNPGARCPYDPPAPGPTSGCNAPPQNEQDWKDFVTAVVTHVAGKIKFWELWNEPDVQGPWLGTTAQMVAMANDAYAIIKSINPAAQVLTPSTDYELWGAGTNPLPWPTGANWLDGYFAAGGTSADIIAFHGYYSTHAEDLPNVILPALQKVLNAHGLASKPIWDTEAGVAASQFSSESDRAAYLAKYYLLHWSLGISRYVWYAWDNYLYGTLWNSSTGINAPGVAYEQVNNWMQGATLSVPCAADGQTTWTCAFTRPGGYQAVAVWNPASPITYSPNQRYSQYRDLSGNTTPVTGSIPVGSSPLLFETGPATATVTNFSGAALGVSSISWTWSAMAGATSYYVLSTSSPTWLGSVSAPLFVLTGLSTNTAYGIVVGAAGLPPLSTAATVYTLAAPPTSFALVQVNLSSITLQWAANTNPAGTTTYRVDYWMATGSTATLTVPTTTAEVTGLSAGASYYFRLSALNGGGVATTSGITLSTITLGSASSSVSASGGTVSFSPLAGPVAVTIPPGAFPAGVDVTLSVPPSFPGAGSFEILGTGVGFQITLDQNVQPAVPATLSVSYQAANLSGIDPNTLVLARYDPTQGVWVPLVSSVNTLTMTVTAQTNHFSLFQVMSVPASNTVSTAKAFPNPLRPAQGQPYMTFAYLPASSRIRIYNVKGVLIKDMTADASGMANWDGTNQSGAAVASGVYFVFAQGAGQSRTLEVAVQR